MTGYGRGEAVRNGYKAGFEVQTVNSRYLEVSLRLPRGLLSLEGTLRKIVDGRLGRGKVHCQLTLERTDQERAVVFNAVLAGQYVTVLNDFAREHDVQGTLTTGDLARLPDIWSTDVPSADAELSAVLEESLTDALEELLVARGAEGEELATDLKKRLALMEGIVQSIKADAADVPEQMREKLTGRIETIIGEGQYDPQRLAQEIAYMAERADITEEIVRLEVHIRQFGEALESGGIIGRRLNFLAQEMNRETNTIGSKSASAAMSSQVVALKEELERIREQVQNIE